MVSCVCRSQHAFHSVSEVVNRFGGPPAVPPRDGKLKADLVSYNTLMKAEIRGCQPLM